MICWDRVNELRDEVGVDDFNEVVEIFLEEVDEVMERLKSGPDHSTYEAELHFLKGSALNLGFSDLVSVCQLGEITARGPDCAEIDLTQVIQVYEMSKVEFNSGQQQVEHAA